MKKKIAFVLMLAVVLLAAFGGTYKSLKDSRQEVLQLYREGNAADESADADASVTVIDPGFSVRNAVNDSADKIRNLLKLAQKYSAENAQLDSLRQGIEEQLQKLDLENAEQANPEILKKLYALADTLTAELEENTDLEAADQKYPGTLQVDLLSLRDEIRHAQYNEQAQEWNKRLSKFPASLVNRIFPQRPLAVYEEL